MKTQTHYSVQLKDRINCYRGRQVDAMHELGHLESYLTSEKFHNDTTVQTADVLRRLENIKTAIRGY
jgi:hypothetical protein